MTIQDFINQHNGQWLDFDGVYGAQCVDLVQFWSKALGGPVFSGNAKDIAGQTRGFYTWVPNSPSGVPPMGAIVVWDGGFNNGPGHVGIRCGNANTSNFDAFVQNDPGGPNGGPAHIKNYSYYHVAGWLVPPVAVDNQGETIVIVGNGDNWFNRFDKTMYQIRGRHASRSELDQFVGKDSLHMLEAISDNPEADDATKSQEVGKQARQDDWPGQINTLLARVDEVTKIADTRKTQMDDMQKQIDTLKAQVAVQSNDTQLLNSFGKALLPLLIRLGIK
jgi:hypothetical protein